ncbi:MAG TPA: hypothetical protein VFD37_07360 [Solirubrobacterales bacterium]|nr:hypothetical protein [Solirubrobacterales bacterium]
MPKAPQLRATVLALTLSAITLLALAAPANARPFSTGVLDVDAYVQDSAIPFQRTKAAGAHYVKRNVYWSIVAPNTNNPNPPVDFNAVDRDDPHYNWESIDKFVKNAVAHGLEPILTVTNSPRWARDRCTNVSECAPKAAPYAEFAYALASRYDGTFNPGDGTLPRVRHFQAWVEPNLDYFYKPVFQGRRPISPTTYRAILNPFYDMVHAVHPDNKVLTAGLAPLARPRTTVGPLDFLRRMLCLQGRRNPKPQRGCNGFAKFDILAIHPYTTGGPTHSAPGPDDLSLGDLHQASQLLRAADRHRKIRRSSGPRRTPLWVTEFSYDSRPPDPGGLSNFYHVQWSSEAMYRMYKAGVDVMIWFGYRDEKPDGRPHCEIFDSGLYRRSGNLAQDRPKPIMRAFRFPFAGIKGGRTVRYWGRTPDSRPGPVILQMKNGRGGLRTVKRVRAGAGGVFETNVRVRGGVQRNAVIRARAPRNGGSSLPFRLHFKRDFYQPPFGRCIRGGGGRPNAN